MFNVLKTYRALKSLTGQVESLWAIAKQITHNRPAEFSGAVVDIIKADEAAKQAVLADVSALENELKDLRTEIGE